MNVILIISMVVGISILMVGGFYLLVYYQHPDDHNEAYIPKLVVLLGFVIAGATVLLLPLDVANNEGYAGCAGYDSKFCGGLNMEAMWDAFFILIPLWVFVFIPFMTFFYEADDGMLMAGTAYVPNPVKRSRVGEALCYTVFCVLIVGGLFTALYFTLSDSKVPVQHYASGENRQAGIGGLVSSFYAIPAQENNTGFDSSLLAAMDSTDTQWLKNVRNEGEQELVLQVSVPVFFGNLMAWFGWFLFALFGGIGLTALPLDLILAYVHRPRHLDAVEYAELQLSLRERVNELVDVGEMIKIEREQKAQAGISGSFAAFSFDPDKRKAARDERQAILGFKQAVFLLEKDVELFKSMSANYENYNPLVPYISLVLGCCSIIISLFWFIHIVVYVFPKTPLAPFLNSYFVWFDKWFPLFGVLSVALFTVYLLFCAVKGCFKFGIRFMCFQIHPMKMGKTYMSSFLFNTALVLLCAMPVVQFCQDAFADYAAFSNIRQIFGVQIQYLQFFGLFWTRNIFVYCFMTFSVLTGIYLACRPRDTAADGQELRDKLRAHMQ